MTDFTSLPIPAKKGSEIDAATTPLSGSETLTITQSGVTKKCLVSDVADLASGGGGGSVVAIDSSQIDTYVTDAQGAYVVANGFCQFSVFVRATGNPTLFGKIWSMPAPLPPPASPSNQSYNFGSSSSTAKAGAYMYADGVLTFSADGAAAGNWININGVYPVSGA